MRGILVFYCGLIEVFKMSPRLSSEEELGRKWDRCIVDTTFKTVGGAVFGTLFSVLFFKRSVWPVTLGIGIGLGAGYSNCRHQFLWHGPHRHAFGRPHWRGPFWRKPGQEPERRPPYETPVKEETIDLQSSDNQTK